MKLIEVDSVPKRRSKHDLQDVMKSFINSDSKICKVELADNDYKSWKVCYSCLRVAAIRSGLRIKVKCRGEDVYLVKE